MSDRFVQSIELFKTGKCGRCLSINSFFEKPRSREELQNFGTFLSVYGTNVDFISMGHTKITTYDPEIVTSLVYIIEQNIKNPIDLYITHSNLGNAEKPVLIALGGLKDLPIKSISLAANNIGNPIQRVNQEELALTNLIELILQNPYLKNFIIGGNDLNALAEPYLFKLFQCMASATKLERIEIDGCGLGELEEIYLIQQLEKILVLPSLKFLNVSTNGLNFSIIKWILINFPHLHTLNIAGNFLYQNTTARDWKELSCFFAVTTVSWQQLEIGNDLDYFASVANKFLYQSYLEFLHLLNDKGVVLTRGGKPIQLPSQKTLPLYYYETKQPYILSTQRYVVAALPMQQSITEKIFKKPVSFWVSL